MKYFTFVKNNWRSKGYPNFKSAVSSGDMMRAYDKRDLIDDIDEIDLDDTLNEEDKEWNKKFRRKRDKERNKMFPNKEVSEMMRKSAKTTYLTNIMSKRPYEYVGPAGDVPFESKVLKIDKKPNTTAPKMNYFTFVKNNWSRLGFSNYKSAISAPKMKDAFRNRGNAAREPPPVNIDIDSMVSNMTKQRDRFKKNENIVQQMKDTLRKKTVKALTYTPHKKPPVNINVDSMVSNMTKQHDKFKNNKNIMKNIHTKPPSNKKEKKHKHINTKQPEPKKRFELNGHINDTFDEDMKKIDDLLNQLPGLPKPRRRVVRRRRV